MKSLHVFFTTDVHGNYFAYDFRYDRLGDGSLERAFGFVEECRELYGRDNVLLLDGGDMIQGGPEAYFFNHVDKSHSHVIGEMCRFAGYDAGAVGNHDIESGTRAMKRFQKVSGYTMVAANITDRHGNMPFAPYVVFNRHGLKVAVVGFTTPSTKRWLAEDVCRDYMFEDIPPCAERWAREIKERENPHVLIALMHGGWKGGIHDTSWRENTAKEVAMIENAYDAVLFGHDHFSRLTEIKRADGVSCVCLNAGCYAYEVGELRISVGDNGDVGGIVGLLHDVKQFSNGHSDDFRTRFSDAFRKVEKYTSEKLGLLTTRLDISHSFLRPSAYMALIHSLQLRVSGADVSLCSPYSTDTVLGPGMLTVADLFTIYWFEDRLYTIRMTGLEIKLLLERSYWLWTNTIDKPGDKLLKTIVDKTTGEERFENLFFNFDTAAGIEYEVDPTKPLGHKVEISRLSDGRTFSLDSEYMVATIGHRANGGGKMLTLGAGIPEEELSRRVVSYTPYDVRHYLRQYIEQQGIIAVKPLDNWRFKGI